MYSAPPGDEFAPNFFIEDVYDGDEKVDDEQGPKLINGLGVLSDGFYGSNVTLLESGLSSGEYFKLSRLNQQKFTSSHFTEFLFIRRKSLLIQANVTLSEGLRRGNQRACRQLRIIYSGNAKIKRFAKDCIFQIQVL